MSVLIDVELPQDEDAEILTPFVTVIKQDWIQNSNLICHLKWEINPLVKSTKHFRLVTGERPSREVLSESVGALRSMPVEQFQQKFQEACHKLSNANERNLSTKINDDRGIIGLYFSSSGRGSFGQGGRHGKVVSSEGSGVYLVEVLEWMLNSRNFRRDGYQLCEIDDMMGWWFFVSEKEMRDFLIKEKL